MADFDKSRLGDYVDVAARIAEFRQKHPEGCLQPADPAQPYRIETIGDRTFVVVIAAAYRSPDDPRPGIGMAYEPWPGRTPYTKDSELMNAETSAWGRAIVAVLAADTKRGLSSREEVENRQVDRTAAAEKVKTLEAAISNARSEHQLKTAWEAVPAAVEAGEISRDDAQRLTAQVKRRKEEFTAQQAQQNASVPLPPDGEAPSDKATRRMHATFRDLAIIQDEKYAVMTHVTGREITSATQLTARDVDAVIVHLDQEKAKGKAAANGAP